ncbi:hypothetical protein JCM1841_002958 [Sporobolomyces salmonicolor]
MFATITQALGFSSTASLNPSDPSTSATTPSDAPPPISIVAEPETTSVAFPAVHSQQRAKAPSASVPSFALSPPSITLADPDAGPQGDDTDDEEEEAPRLPQVRIEGDALAPPTTTQKVVKAPKGRVRVEKGFSQLDWAKLNRSGVDLRGGATSLRPITATEVALHNTRDDCWQVYGGKVYNVGPFLRYHPGGVGEMMRGAGKDVLAHAWVNYDTLLENCLVGFIVRE